MADRGTIPSRRDVLKATGGALGSTTAVGLAAARPTDLVEVNVGYAAPDGRKAALEAATTVVREFAFDALTVRAPKEAVTGLQRRPDVRYVEENGTYRALGQTLPRGVDRVDADVAHANGSTGDGADVAVIDTGIVSDHPDLVDNLGAGEAFVDCESRPRGGCRFGVKPNENPCSVPWDDDNDHGTHCSGIANAVNDAEGVVGVATNATLHAAKALDACGSGSYSDVAAAVQWTADQGYDVGSMSLGGDSSSQTLRDACQYAYDRGVLLVAAAGNSGPCSDCVGYPAAYDTVVAVSATTRDDDLADFSSTGPEVEIAAPGEDVLSSVYGGYARYDGTSMACPHVSGAGAMLMASGYSNSEARIRLRNAAEDVGLAENESGSGLLDVTAALGYDSSDST